MTRQGEEFRNSRSAVLIMLGAVALGACSRGFAETPTASDMAMGGQADMTLAPTSKLSQTVVAALGKHEGAPVELISATREAREGHEVVCGWYVRSEPAKGEAANAFGWVDGELMMSFGPVWNPATLCLIRHYKMPLP